MDAVANPIGLVSDTAAIRSSPITSTAPFAATIDPRPAPTPSRPVLATAHTPVPLDRLETRSDMKRSPPRRRFQFAADRDARPFPIDDCNAPKRPFPPGVLRRRGFRAAPPAITSSVNCASSLSFNDLSTAAARGASRL